MPASSAARLPRSARGGEVAVGQNREPAVLVWMIGKMVVNFLDYFGVFMRLAGTQSHIAISYDYDI